MHVQVEISRFSGPLELLLHLIRKEEMDIFDINIHEITAKYLDSIKTMGRLNLEAAGDFVAMAATLLQIKSKLLLPQYNEAGELVEDEDPRKDLVQRLLAYQKFKDLGQDLYARDLLGRDVFTRGVREELHIPDEQVVIEEDNALFALISAFRTSYLRLKKSVHNVAKSLQSIADRVLELRHRLLPGVRVRLFELIDRQLQDKEVLRGQLLITFLSMLELAKIGVVRLFQNEEESDIHIEAIKSVDENAISSMEKYEAPTAAAQMNLFGGDTDFQEEPAEQTAEAPVEAISDHSEEINAILKSPLEGLPEEEAATDEEILAEEIKYERESGRSDGDERSDHGQVGDIERVGDVGELRGDNEREPDATV